MKQYQYRVVENKPYGTWAIEELWEGGVVRSPFKTKEEAIQQEQAIAQKWGFGELLKEAK